MEIGMALLRGEEDDDDVFQPPKKRQRLENVVPVVPAKPKQAAKAPAPTADWLTGRLAVPQAWRPEGRMAQRRRPQRVCERRLPRPWLPF